METELSTEERIKEAAKKVFLEKGFDGTTTRDIAREAGLSIAMMNYYFRSKEKLFNIVYEELIREYFQSTLDIMDKPGDLKQKLSALVDNFFNLFKKNRRLSTFINYELKRNPDHLLKTFDIGPLVKKSLFIQQLQDAINKGEIRAINSDHVLFLLLPNVQFLYENDELNKKILLMDEADYDQFAQEHLQIVKEMIFGHLFLDN
ncbi:TetR/AcrR family transcriptional regulator [Pontibacter kalidii]|uniref:TetR/AcrR family transcriptional regulator n=1 Tax=Pontibacter kalidii TaxID=2592049 RepID=UPI00225B93B0|nr:TetR/AcrR family transcriptional regulator [Pontibacter kalidii]